MVCTDDPGMSALVVFVALAVVMNKFDGSVAELLDLQLLLGSVAVSFDYNHSVAVALVAVAKLAFEQVHH